MTFSGVVIGVAIVALILTAILKLTTDRIKKFVLSFFQNFCGVLFLISGWVKAIDPLGTAYKMEQYFGEFQVTFEGTSFDFLSGLFPLMSEYSIGFSVFMIVFEIVIGLMLILGAKRKIAAWAFLLLIIFFTILTGFTYLTGYVPSTENFFSFSKWGPYVETNMRVTDCGCFGDFLVIEPKISFLKDIVLLIPSIIFVFMHNDMHQLFSEKTRNVLVGAVTIGLIWYCLSNFSWNLPHTDFRPFAEGTNIREQRLAEIEATNNVQITDWVLKNRKSGKVVQLSTPVYYAEMTTNYKKEDWEVIEHIKTKPAVKATKLSEFVVNDEEGNDVSDELLDTEGYRFWIISHKVPYDVTYEKVVDMDTLYLVDTIFDETTKESSIVKSIDQVVENEQQIAHYTFKPKYLNDYSKEMSELIKSSGLPTIGFFGGVDPATLDALKSEIDIDMKMYEADDILLKTIIRSNPGLMLLKDGMVVKKWHKENLPSVDQLKSLTSASSNN